MIYMLFAGRTFYPEGGTEDLIAAFRAENDDAAVRHAKDILSSREHDWAYLSTFTDSLKVRVVWDPGEFCEASWR